MPVSHAHRRYAKIGASLLAAIAVLVTGRKTYDYAAAPTDPKNCDYIYPKASDQTKPTTLILDSSVPAPLLKQSGGVINDASCLNQTAVYGIVHVASPEHVRQAIEYARANDLKITPAGERHSMGGQTFTRGGLVLDMHGLNSIKLNKERRTVTVGAGARWEEIQRALDPEGLAVKAMQSINIFTVGGTLSVNAHGIAHDPGPVASTVRSMKVMLPNGVITTASRSENPDLFRHVLGGYGLFGVILEAELDVVDNEMYVWNTDYMGYTDVPEFFATGVRNNAEIGLMYGRLSMSPGSYLREAAIHTYRKTEFDDKRPALKLPSNTWLNRLVINFSKTGGFGRRVRWMLEKYVEPHVHTCLTRNEALNQKEACLVTRNQEMYDSMGYLKNRLRDTDILQEYFIPYDRMPEFIDGLRTTVEKNGANLLNVTIRNVYRDRDTALPYAKDDMFAFVLYFNQRFNEKESAILRKTTTDLIDVAAEAGGTYYLPYQLYYTPEQLRAAYPEVDAFFAAKRRYDPEEIFSNKWYEKYGREREV